MTLFNCSIWFRLFFFSKRKILSSRYIKLKCTAIPQKLLGKKTTTLIRAMINSNDSRHDDDDKSSDSSLSKGYKSPEMHHYGPVYREVRDSR